MPVVHMGVLVMFWIIAKPDQQHMKYITFCYALGGVTIKHTNTGWI